MSPSSIVHSGPASTRVKSMTLRPERGKGAGSGIREAYQLRGSWKGFGQHYLVARLTRRREFQVESATTMRTRTALIVSAAVTEGLPVRHRRPQAVLGQQLRREGAALPRPPRPGHQGR